MHRGFFCQCVEKFVGVDVLIDPCRVSGLAEAAA